MSNRATGSNQASISCMRGGHGVVLPMALIMLIIISLAGLQAARTAATHEQFSNNMRTTQVARQSAEAALRYCESVVIDIENDGSLHAALKGKIVPTELTPDNIKAGAWNTRSNWSSGAPNLITYAPAFNNAVQNEVRTKTENHPTCVIQAMTERRFLVTARGLSNDATVNANDQLARGSEIWLQSVLTPGIPLKSASGGNQ